MKPKIRMGMVGGGRGAFIGAIHRMAARLDGEIELVAGAFASEPRRSRLSGRDLGLEPNRIYADVQEMLEGESRLPEEERIEFVSIVTPNHTHFPIARDFLTAGFAVLCDKPLAMNLQEAAELRALSRRRKLPFAVSYNYSGYPLVREARERIARGELGDIQKVIVEYTQDWLIKPIEKSGQKQAAWRTDPRRAGPSGCLGDIGTHAEHLVRCLTGLRLAEVSAEFHSFVKGRRLEDDASVLLRYRGGARGVLIASQIAAGEENNLRVRIYGTRASLEWRQEDPNELLLKYPDAPRRTLRRGTAYLGSPAKASTRLPPGHPEAFIEAFANIYRDFAAALRQPPRARRASATYPTVEDGYDSMAFLEAAVTSAQAGGRWTRVPA